MLFILATPFLLYISKKACDNMFPKFMSEIYLKIGVFLFRIYFMCYVFIQNVRKNKLFKRSNVKSIIFIKNGKTMFEHNLDDIILKPSMFNDYDLILYKTLNNTSSNYKYEYNILRLSFVNLYLFLSKNGLQSKIFIIIFFLLVLVKR